MPALNQFISFAFVPNAGSNHVDTGTTLKGKLHVKVHQEIGVNELSYSLKLNSIGTIPLENNQSKKNILDKFTTWKKDEELTFDIELKIPKNKFSYSGELFVLKASIEFKTYFNHETVKKINRAHSRYGTLTSLFSLNDGYTKSFPLEINNTGAFTVRETQTTQAFNNELSLFYLGLLLLISTVSIMFLGTFNFFTGLALGAGGYLIYRGLKHVQAQWLLGKIQAETTPISNKQFEVVITIPKMKNVQHLAYNLQLEEKIRYQKGEHIHKTEAVIHQELTQEYSSPQAKQIHWLINYPDEHLPGTFKDKSANLFWYLPIVITYKNKFNYVYRLPITLIKHNEMNP